MEELQAGWNDIMTVSGEVDLKAVLSGLGSGFGLEKCPGQLD